MSLAQIVEKYAKPINEVSSSSSSSSSGSSSSASSSSSSSSDSSSSSSGGSSTVFTPALTEEDNDLMNYMDSVSSSSSSKTEGDSSSNANTGSPISEDVQAIVDCLKTAGVADDVISKVTDLVSEYKNSLLNKITEACK